MMIFRENSVELVWIHAIGLDLLQEPLLLCKAVNFDWEPKYVDQVPTDVVQMGPETQFSPLLRGLKGRGSWFGLCERVGG